jgi:hypothetical protein
MSDNISWSKNANYEKLANNYQEHTEVIQEKMEFIPVNNELLSEILSNFELSYRSKPTKQVYDGMVMLESIIKNLN